MKYKITIAYDGTKFCGWQIQPNGRSIQSEIENALHIITKKPIKITGAGRTDAGVHARGQIAHFICDSMPQFLLKQLNALTSDEISILSLDPVEETFHARFSAKEKTYIYSISTDPIQLPFEMPYSFHYTYPICFDSMKTATKDLLGTHDFSAFANQFNREKNPVKTLYKIDFETTKTGFALIFCGDGFLYKMVRNLTGLLLEIGRQKLPPSAAYKILVSRDRKTGSFAAPPHGLCLHSIRY